MSIFLFPIPSRGTVVLGGGGGGSRGDGEKKTIIVITTINKLITFYRLGAESGKYGEDGSITKIITTMIMITKIIIGGGGRARPARQGRQDGLKKTG